MQNGKLLTRVVPDFHPLSPCEASSDIIAADFYHQDFVCALVMYGEVLVAPSILHLNSTTNDKLNKS